MSLSILAFLILFVLSLLISLLETLPIAFASPLPQSILLLLSLFTHTIQKHVSQTYPTISTHNIVTKKENRAIILKSLSFFTCKVGIITASIRDDSEDSLLVFRSYHVLATITDFEYAFLHH